MRLCRASLRNDTALSQRDFSPPLKCLPLQANLPYSSFNLIVIRVQWLFENSIQIGFGARVIGDVIREELPTLDVLYDAALLHLC